MVVLTDPVIIKSGGGKQYAVNGEVLASSSPVFQDLIASQGKHELDMKRFNSASVLHFLDLLENKAAGGIEDRYFQDLLRLSTEFNVEWLMKECHKRLADRILGQEKRIVSEDWEYGELEVIWEEILVMVSQWGETHLVFVDLFVKMVQELGEAKRRKFVEEFVKRNLVPLEVDVIVKSTEICNLGVVMAALLDNIEKNDTLTDKSRLLLGNLNMTLCKIHCPDEYEAMTKVLSSRFLIMSSDDMKLVLDLIINSSVPLLQAPISMEHEVGDYRWMRDKFFPESGPVPITQVVEDGEVGSVNTVVDCILHLLLGHWGELPPLLDINQVLDTLEKAARDRGLHRAHRPYIRSCIGLLKKVSSGKEPDTSNKLSWSLENMKLENTVVKEEECPGEKYLELLSLVENSDVLSSDLDNVEVECAAVVGDLACFSFCHPGVNPAACSWMGTKCGFLIQTEESKLDGDDEVGAVEQRLKFIRKSKDEDGVLEIINSETGNGFSQASREFQARFLQMMTEKMEALRATLARSPPSSTSEIPIPLLTIEEEEEEEDEVFLEPVKPHDIHCHDIISAKDMSLMYTKLMLEEEEEGCFVVIVPVDLCDMITSLLNKDGKHKVSRLNTRPELPSQFVIYNIAEYLVRRRS